MTNLPKITLVGAGLVGQQHIKIINDRAALAAVVDPDPTAKKLAAQYDVPWFPSVEDHLSVARPDGVLLATPNQHHVPQALTCVSEGLPVLVEKPVADTAESAARLISASTKAGVPVLVGHHRRHSNIVKRAKRAISDGHLGRIVTVNAQFWLYKPAPYFDPAWRRQSGAGPIFINLIHDIDLLQHLCGEIQTVQAVESRAIRGFEVEDTAAILMVFANGAIGTASLSDTAVAPWSWEFTSGENPAYPNVSAHAYAIAGTEAALSVPDLTLWRHPDQRGWWEPMASETLSVELNNPLVQQMDHFVDVIRGGSEPLVDVRTATQSLAVIEAIKRAAETGGTVTVEKIAKPV